MEYLIGIDEAGRGPLAGPVAVGVVMCASYFGFKLLKDVRDPKKLSEKQREGWFVKLKSWQKESKKTGKNKIDFKVSLIGAKVIDEKGINFAIKRGIKNCLKRLEADPSNSKVLLDGSLKAPKNFKNQQTIIGGDDIKPIISIASVVAKVIRDRKMKRLAKLYPKYQFDVHKGYGTALHYEAIKKFGLCKIHRRSFIEHPALRLEDSLRAPLL